MNSEKAVRLVMLAAATVLSTPGTAVAARSDPTDPGVAVDLLGASLVQEGPALRWTVHTRGPVTAASLAVPGGQRLCLVLFYEARAAAQSRVCLIGGAHSRLSLRYTTLTTDGRPSSVRALPGVVAGATSRTVKATFNIAATGLQQRRFRWQVQATSVATAQCGAPTALQCVDILPNVSTIVARTVLPVPIGCLARGASQVSRIPGGPNIIALTFDDGPSSYTPQFLRILEADKVPATFFEVGSEIAGRTRLLRRMLADGDAIGNHTYTHVNMAGGGNEGQITRTQRAIRAATGYTPCVFRPPYGSTSGALVSEVRALELVSVLWSVDPRDWSTPGTGAIQARIVSQTRHGAIVLMHDGGGPRSQTVAALRNIIRIFKARGYRFKTVPDALGYVPVYGTTSGS